MEDEGLKWIRILFITLFVATILFTILKPYEDMYSVTFYHDNKEINVGTDVNGLINRTPPGESKWKDRSIIEINKLKKGDTLQMFDLYSDVLMPEFYKVKEVHYDAGIL